MQTLGAIMAVFGLALVFVARANLGKSFSVRPDAKELVTKGLYSRIRHPMYVFVDVTFFGLVLALELYWLILLLVGLAICQTYQARREGKVLRQKFGQLYLDYRDRTWF
jgi:protein-S-isoprenylcysteine O-methyltransferase Ste14